MPCAGRVGQLNHVLDALEIPGASPAIVSGNRVIFAKGFGLSSVETPTAWTRCWST